MRGRCTAGVAKPAIDAVNAASPHYAEFTPAEQAQLLMDLASLVSHTRKHDLTLDIHGLYDKCFVAQPRKEAAAVFCDQPVDSFDAFMRVRDRMKPELLDRRFKGDLKMIVATDRAMYRFGLTKGGAPKTEWKKKYANSGIVKPGQAEAGTGTTPTIMRGGYVAITDNADPMNVVVYRTAKKLKGKSRVVCQVPVFHKGKSATENSLIGTGRSLLVENNYGYTDIFAADAAQVVTEPGFARIDIKKNGKGCKKVWTSYAERAPSVVSKLSTKTGLIYSYTRPPDPSGTQGYYWTAIRFKNGKTAWSKYSHELSNVSLGICRFHMLEYDIRIYKIKCIIFENR